MMFRIRTSIDLSQETRQLRAFIITMLLIYIVYYKMEKISSIFIGCKNTYNINCFAMTGDETSALRTLAERRTV